MKISCQDIADSITPVGYRVYPASLDPLDPETVQLQYSVVDTIATSFHQISGESPADWYPYILSLESVVSQMETDITFLMFWIQHFAHASIRKFLPKSDGTYEVYYATAHSATLMSLGSLSAVVSYFTGTLEPHPHFRQLFNPNTDPLRHSTFPHYVTSLLQDLTDFYNFPGMPSHFRVFLREYIFNVKLIAFATSYAEYEMDHTGKTEADQVVTL